MGCRLPLDFKNQAWFKSACKIQHYEHAWAISANVLAQKSGVAQKTWPRAKCWGTITWSPSPWPQSSNVSLRGFHAWVPLQARGKRKTMIFIERKDLFLLQFHMPQTAHSDLWIPCNQSPFVQMHLQTGWEFENTSSSAVSFCPETGQLQLLNWTSALATRTKICSTTPWRPSKIQKLGRWFW